MKNCGNFSLEELAKSQLTHKVTSVSFPRIFDGECGSYLVGGDGFAKASLSRADRQFRSLFYIFCAAKFFDSKRDASSVGRATPF